MARRNSRSFSDGIFRPRRFALLLKRDFSAGYRGLLIAMAAVAGFVILISVVSMVQGRGGEHHLGWYAGLLFIGGYIVSSLAFRELHQNGMSYFYLTLPGSKVEKFTSKLLATSLGYALGTLVFYSAVAALSEGLNRLIFGYGHLFFNPLRREVLLMVAVYLVSQSVFLLGSAYFRKLAFIKTWLSGTILLIAIGVAVGLTVYLLFGDLMHASSPDPRFQIFINEMGRSGRLATVLGPFARRYWLVIKILFWGALAPACWVISYFRLGETEV